jgi:hypothetical protein
MEYMYVFGYGSLMNARSLGLTIPGSRPTRRAVLQGYVRKCNFLNGANAYLNIALQEHALVRGTLIPVNKEELEALKLREFGYACVDVTSRIEEAPQDGEPIYAFIAPDVACEVPVPRSYLLTCLGGVPEEERATWLEETIIPYGIFEDSQTPLYQNFA